MQSPIDYPDRIYLKGMSFYGYTGVFPFEKREGQKFLVDLTLFFRRIPGVVTDEIGDTVHYGEVFDAVKFIVENSAYDLIEKLAGEIVFAVLSRFPLIDAAEVVVSKPDAPVEGIFDSMCVSLFRERTGRPEVEEQ